MSGQIRVAVIVGSNREGRAADMIADWFVDHAAGRDDVEMDIVDLAEVDLPSVYPNELNDSVRAFLGRLDEADAFVIVTPEYNHSFPAGLKQAIDLADAEWQAKPVGFVSYGGASGGLRAVEALRLVLAEMHATTVRSSVSLHRYWELFDEEATLAEPAPHASAADSMLDQLVWWARALRSARAEVPYAA